MNPARVIFAVASEDERTAFARASQDAGFAVVHFPRDIADVEALFAADQADVIVTDFRFHSGAFADWLTLWPLPSVLLVDSADSGEKIERTTADESSLFLERDPEGRYLARIPLYIHKVLNIRESLSRQNAHLKMTEHQYMNLLQAIPDIVYTLDGDGCFMYLNDSVRNLGFEPEKLIGKHFSEIIHPADVPKVSRSAVLRDFKGVATGPESAPKLFDERRSGPRMTRNLELRLRHKVDQEDFHYATVNSYGEVSCAGWKLPEYENIELGTVGIIRDITSRKEHEFRLEEALSAKEVLLKEIHHRVKNNLQVVSSLLNLQENVVDDPAARKVFLECQTQIQSMAMVHEVLYRSENFEGVQMQAYFERLADYLSSVYDAPFHGLVCTVEAPEVILSLDSAIPVALIVNELISNAFKHAFPEGRGGKVSVELKLQSGMYQLVVADDGIGFEESQLRSNSEPGLGTELVQALVAQLHGELDRSSRGIAQGGSQGSALGGARVRISFPK